MQSLNFGIVFLLSSWTVKILGVTPLTDSYMVKDTDYPLNFFCQIFMQQLYSCLEILHYSIRYAQDPM